MNMKYSKLYRHDLPFSKTVEIQEPKPRTRREILQESGQEKVTESRSEVQRS